MNHNLLSKLAIISIAFMIQNCSSAANPWRHKKNRQETGRIIKSAEQAKREAAHKETLQRIIQQPAIIAQLKKENAQLKKEKKELEKKLNESTTDISTMWTNQNMLYTQVASLSTEFAAIKQELEILKQPFNDLIH